jgi:rSAM/selenodomain-associated transferase 2
VIVVDGGSTDGSAEIARRHAGVQVIKAPKGRAVQMNVGARVARGEWLLFLHADTLLPEGALLRVSGLQCAAGAFRHAFSGRGWRLRAVSWLHNQRCRYTRVFFGDQAMFVRAALFWRLGGFPEVAVLEDVLLSEKLRQATRPAFLQETVVTDARKFLAKGVWRTTLRALAILLRHETGLPVRSGAFFEDVR